ncbi:Zn-dependent exopeptidase [Lactarius akahatsu]|uniref:Zn-dependent exopeptidase n=1 Tax=Lactarius akahatsu TaxID=416441 RepID=A0AAD4LD35_9AGAM|nr:Zn-dependent exopeptidase [Lactarius akahatsu]
MEDEKFASAKDSPFSEPVAIPANSRTKRIVKYSICFGLVWFIVHSWFIIPRRYIFVGDPSSHTSACTHSKYAWVTDAFAPKDPQVPHGRLAENFFLTIPNSASAIAASRKYATKPHLAGSDGDLLTAKYFLDLLQHELSIPKGTDDPVYPAGSVASRNATLSITHLTEPVAWIDVYYPVLNTPLDRSLEILGDDGHAAWKAELEEIGDELDSDAYTYADSVGAWHGLSKDGEAEGRLIFANYGRKSDYDELVEKGVDFTGAIVLVRYGGLFRGLKVKGAQELGAAGVLIYSDPRDDGTVTEANGYAPYPYGPARNPTSVQRGSVQFLSIYPGDPTTPGYPSYENSTRTDGTNIPSIPSLPISWANAKVLLEEIDGKNRPVKLTNHVDTKVTPIWNTMGVIPGHIKDEVVVVGNHRDAWVLGAVDPSSGTVSVHEVVRGLGALLKEGWKPLRTIVIASWDAEEYGLIGSTEWGEDFSEWIQEHVVAYVNLDSSVSGSKFGAAGSPSLAHFIRKTAEDLPHPTDPKRTLWDATADRGQLFGEHNDVDSLGTEVETEAMEYIGIRPLGSGSDYTVFLQRLGVASMDSGGFTSTLSDPVYHYHSVYDSERWQEVYGDPGFVKHVAVAKNLGLQTLRLATALVLPFNTTNYAFELEYHLNVVEKLAASSATTPNLVPLRAAIKSLQFASLEFDAEKYRAEFILKGLIRKWHQSQLQREHSCFRSLMRRLRHFFTAVTHRFPCVSKPVTMAAPRSIAGSHSRFPCVSKSVMMAAPCFGKPATMAALPSQPRRPQPLSLPGADEPPAEIEGRPDKNGVDTGMHRIDDEVNVEDGDWPHLPIPHRPKHPHWHWPHKPRHPPRALIAAAKAVRKINQKLASFERGFIHEDGIKDREWYRHLGVAPGKWLGYGATTLPGLTEAITIEKNITLANDEAARLTEAVENIRDALRA